MKYAIFFLQLIFLLVFSSPFSKQIDYLNKPQSPDYERISSIPDYYQKENRFGTYPLNGSMYCGPAAVSNSLVWLAQNGFPSLMESSGNTLFDQHKIIEKLASKEYMNTRSIGSTVQDLCRGVKKYLNECDVNSTLFFEGMYTVNANFRGASIPKLDNIIKFTSGARTAWLNIGWYKYNTKANEYYKSGGHWVTLVGYKIQNNTISLIINNPGTKACQIEFLNIEEIKNGVVFNNNKNFPVNASGFYRFKTGKNSYGIIGGIVYLSLENENIVSKYKAQNKYILCAKASILSYYS